MNGKLCGIKVWPGVIGSHRSVGAFGNLIGKALGKSYIALTNRSDKYCPSHNFIIVEHGKKLWVGESVHPKARLVSFAEYEAKLADGKVRNVQLFEVHDVSKLRQGMAAAWWVGNVLGKKYDWLAFPRLLLKAVFGDRIKRAAGSVWKWWCTEGIKDAFKKYEGAGYDVYHNENPTPLTTIKRWQEGRLRLLL